MHGNLAGGLSLTLAGHSGSVDLCVAVVGHQLISTSLQHIVSTAPESGGQFAGPG